MSRLHRLLYEKHPHQYGNGRRREVADRHAIRDATDEELRACAEKIATARDAANDNSVAVIQRDLEEIRRIECEKVARRRGKLLLTRMRKQVAHTS